VRGVAGVLVVMLLVAGSAVAGCSGAKKTAKTTPGAADRAPGETTTPRDGTSGADAGASLLSFPDIYFDYDRHALSAGAKTTLAEHARRLETNPTIRIRVEGHCDERGTSDYNLALGERRAQSAADYLVAYGIDGDRITTISYGKERPIDPGHNEQAWSRNRRAAFVVTNDTSAR